jgi:plasmid maintenance system antidote protein VapI
VPANRISEIIRGRRAITADTALRLSEWLGTSAEFWMRLQEKYDLELTHMQSGDEIRAQVQQRLRPPSVSAGERVSNEAELRGHSFANSDHGLSGSSRRVPNGTGDHTHRRFPCDEAVRSMPGRRYT